MTERNAKYQLDGLVELDDAYFGGVSHGTGKQGRGTDQDPEGRQGQFERKRSSAVCPFWEGAKSLKKDTVLAVLKRRVVTPYGVWLNDGADIYARPERQPIKRSTGSP